MKFCLKLNEYVFHLSHCSMCSINIRLKDGLITLFWGYIVTYFASQSLQCVTVHISTAAFQNEARSRYIDSAASLPSELAVSDISPKGLWLQATEILGKNMDKSLGSKGKTEIDSEVI